MERMKEGIKVGKKLGMGGLQLPQTPNCNCSLVPRPTGAPLVLLASLVWLASLEFHTNHIFSWIRP